MAKIRNNSNGFTIVELLIAISVFSVILLICAFAIIQVGRMYYKGVIIGRTQDVSRRVVEEIAQNIQFGTGSKFPDEYVQHTVVGGVEVYCIGRVKYSYIKTDSLGTIPHVLWRDTFLGGTCAPSAFTAGTSEELLGENMRLPVFEITHDPSGIVWTINLRVAYGDDSSLFVGAFEYCKGTSAGGQFCAISNMRTSVVRRL